MDADETAPQIIARLYADYAPAIVRHLERMTHDRETAEDLAQETFIKALRDPEQLASVGNARAWLFRVATHTAYDEFRRQRRRQTTPLTDVHANTLRAEHSESTFAEVEPIRAALERQPTIGRRTASGVADTATQRARPCEGRRDGLPTFGQAAQAGNAQKVYT